MVDFHSVMSRQDYRKERKTWTWRHGSTTATARDMQGGSIEGKANMPQTSPSEFLSNASITYTTLVLTGFWYILSYPPTDNPRPSSTILQGISRVEFGGTHATKTITAGRGKKIVHSRNDSPCEAGQTNHAAVQRANGDEQSVQKQENLEIFHPPNVLRDNTKHT